MCGVSSMVKLASDGLNLALAALCRNQQDNRGNALFELGRQLIRKANNVGADGAQPATKKRKTPAAPQTLAPDVVELVFLDE